MEDRPAAATPEGCGWFMGVALRCRGVQVDSIDFAIARNWREETIRGCELTSQEVINRQVALIVVSHRADAASVEVAIELRQARGGVDVAIHQDVSCRRRVKAVHVGVALEPIWTEIVDAAGLQMKGMDQSAVIGRIRSIRRFHIDIVALAPSIGDAKVVKL